MNELNEFMATEVMGYIVDSANWLDYFGYSKTNEFIIAVDEWKPTEDLNQAMMCAENSKVNVSLSCSRTKDGDAKWELMRNGLPYPVEYDEQQMMLRSWYSRKELPETICKAIKPAIEKANK